MIQQWSSLVFYPKELKNLCSYRNWETDVRRSFIHNCQNMGPTEMYFSRWMDEPWYIQTIEHYAVLQG
jgi:hypothetical protein